MKYEFCLYLTGFPSQYKRAIQNLKEVFDSKIEDPYEIEVVNILQHPELAEEENIVASPTLVVKNSTTKKKIIGDFRNHEKLLNVLGWAEY